MRFRSSSLLVSLMISATAVFAHTGVKDPQVKARMDLMGLVANDMKILGGMAKGITDFDAALVANTSASLAVHASQIESLFEDQAKDPKSEAKDTVWSDWDGFLTKATEMETAALALEVITSEEDFRSAFGVLGKTCSTCHQGYRINKN